MSDIAEGNVFTGLLNALPTTDVVNVERVLVCFKNMRMVAGDDTALKTLYDTVKRAYPPRILLMAATLVAADDIETTIADILMGAIRKPVANGSIDLFETKIEGADPANMTPLGRPVVKIIHVINKNPTGGSSIHHAPMRMPLSRLNAIDPTPAEANMLINQVVGNSVWNTPANNGGQPAAPAPVINYNAHLEGKNFCEVFATGSGDCVNGRRCNGKRCWFRHAPVDDNGVVSVVNSTMADLYTNAAEITGWIPHNNPIGGITGWLRPHRYALYCYNYSDNTVRFASRDSFDTWGVIDYDTYKASTIATKLRKQRTRVN
jgi:hypothetical protein